MSKFSDLLSALGLAPKTLPQANETLTAARAQLDTVSALFTAAGLNLEQMLSGGPDALKLHLASLDQSAELSTLNAQLSTLKEEATDATELIAVLEEDGVALSEAVAHITTAIALPVTKDTSAADIKSAFAAHVEKQATLKLASTGHPPGHVPAAVDTPAPAKSGAELLAEYSAMKAGTEKQAFYAKHEAALWGAARA